MVLPDTISETSPLDPLLLLPLPSPLPESPLPKLQPLLSALEDHLSNPLPDTTAGSSFQALPITIWTTQMRQITRSTQVLLNAARFGAYTAREELDGVDVELRGVEYERERVGEEIRLCGEYAPKYLELDLPDPETFVANASDEVLSLLPPPEDETYEHILTIARLENELKEIQAREELLATLTKDRDSLIKSKREMKMAFDKAETFLKDLSRTVDLVQVKLKETDKVTIPKLSTEIVTPPTIPLRGLEETIEVATEPDMDEEMKN